MAKKTQQDLQNVDRRLVDRQIARGDFSRTELDGALDKLPDLKSASEDISASIYGASAGSGEGE